MQLLALDTATRHATVALLCEDERQSITEREREVTTHSEGLLSMLDELLAEAGGPQRIHSAGGDGRQGRPEKLGLSVAGLDAIVCGLGPGSFTGLRIGLATAKGLCLAARRPLLGLSSLLPLAAAVEAAFPGEERLACAVLDARRGEVFTRRFRGGVALEPDRLCRPETLVAELAASGEPILLAGDGALLYRELLCAGGVATLAPEDCHAIHARHLALAARERVTRGDFDDLASLAPRYLRASDARLPEAPLWRAETK
jgi:tRNA threonylcarbamoyladenosine biosynthesis protein TsaB